MCVDVQTEKRDLVQNRRVRTSGHLLDWLSERRHVQERPSTALPLRLSLGKRVRQRYCFPACRWAGSAASSER